jgi:hypothetical protein
MDNTEQRGQARKTYRRVRVRSTPHYDLWQLQEAKPTPHAPRKQLSPAALWILLAYLPPEVRSRPWVRHLVEQQLARVETPVPEPAEASARRAPRPDRAPVSPRAIT